MINTVAFRKPLSREIDIFIAVSKPKDLIILGSVKNTKRPVSVDKLTDFKETVNSARSNLSKLVISFAVSRSVFPCWFPVNERTICLTQFLVEIQSL
jgi:hypothetical protein